MFLLEENGTNRTDVYHIHFTREMGNPPRNFLPSNSRISVISHILADIDLLGLLDKISFLFN